MTDQQPPSFCDHRNAVARRNDPARLRAGMVVIPPAEAVQLIVDGEIRWDVGPQEHRSWQMFLHSLQWVEKLIEAAETDDDGEDIAAATRYARSWVENHPVLRKNDGPWHDHATSMRARTLACLRSQGISDEWLVAALLAHGEVLRDERRYAGPYNHGINQDLALVVVGTVVGKDEWVDFAAQRLGEVAKTSISPDGVLDEQAPRYSNYLFSLWSQAIELLRRTERAVPEGISERLERMPEFMAHATLPDGRYVPFGDSYRRAPLRVPGTYAEYAATRGEAGPRPTQTSRVYQEGYAFARSGWGEHRPFNEESYYALRFGPARYRHGHYDHTSFVYAAKGRLVVTDSGHCNYQRDEYRDHLVSSSAHNVVEAVALPIDPGHQTDLVSSSQHGDVHSYELRDSPYQGVSRTRRLTFMLDWDVIVVHDTVTADQPRQYRQLTHLDPGLDLRPVGPTEMAAADVRIQGLLDIGPANPMRLVRGESDPPLGWVSYEQDQREPAGVVVYEASGHTVEFLSVICCQPGVRTRLVGGKRRRLRVRRGLRRRDVDIPREQGGIGGSR